MQYLPANFIEKTATLDEVLGPGFITVSPGDGGFGIDRAFWTRWKQLTCHGDEDRFKRLIESRGWGLEACRSRLQSFRCDPNHGDSALEKRAQATVNLLVQADNSESPMVEADGTQTPFFELIAPVIGRADQELKSALLSGGFSEKHAAPLSRRVSEQLKQSLVDLLGPILFSLFQQHKAQLSAAESGPALYSTFVERMRSRGFRQLFEARPILLRLIATLHYQWLASMLEFLCRLEKDISAVTEMLLSKPARRCLDDLKDFEFGLSDPHNEGRSVIVVNFQCGEKVLYKPKDLRPEHHMSELLAHLKACDPQVDLRVPKCIPMNGYGWMEFIECRPCADPQQVSAYYQRAGAWLALIYLLDGSDIHEENLIACGEQPVPVDLEVLFQGTSVPSLAKDARHLAQEKVRHTVLGVGMLPTYGRDHKQQSFEIGGLKAGRYKEKTLVWTDVNTDYMNMEVQERERSHDTNLPRLGNEIQEAKKHHQPLIDGFERCMGLFLNLRDSGRMMQILQRFKSLKFRKVYRPTYFYYSMLERLRDFKYWRNGLEWSLQAEFVFRLVDWGGTSAQNPPAVAAHEKAALLNLSIPYFKQSADASARKQPDESDRSDSPGDGFSLACARLSALSENDVEREVHLINLALETKPSARKPWLKDAGTVSLLDTPEKMARFIANQAIRHNGTAAWLGLDWHADLGKSQLVVLGQDLYNGNGGIAIFLAACAKLLAKHDLKQLAYEAVALMRGSIADPDQKIYAKRIGIGGGTGLTSYAYVLATLSQLLDEPALLNEAGHLIDQLDDHLIGSDASYDVLSGNAGAILALLKCHRLDPRPRTLETATACAIHLLKHMAIWKESVANPKPDATIQANGFAHGAAGISLALVRLAQATGKDLFRSAALEMVEFENASFSTRASNWPDLRHRHLPASTWACQWCHGATGIGLARLCAADGTASAESRSALLQDVQRALKGVSLLEWPGPLDSLCCGNAGNIEFLREAGLRLDRPELTERAESLFAGVIDRHRVTGDFAWNLGNTAFNLGFFRGLSGLGYAMLRGAHPGILPNVLIWA
jgi:type 2 lantibiotic biosynthesis protein LanM